MIVAQRQDRQRHIERLSAINLKVSASKIVKSAWNFVNINSSNGLKLHHFTPVSKIRTPDSSRCRAYPSRIICYCAGSLQKEVEIKVVKA